MGPESFGVSEMKLFKTHRIVGANPNKKGRDLFVGDIHGRHTRLMKQLDRIGFDKSRDRLFCTGDLVDRFDENIESARLLLEPWFFSTLGNHEFMLLQATKKKANYDDIARHLKKGGDWAHNSVETPMTPTPEGLEARDLVKKFACGLLTVETVHGNIGVIHADAPAAWPTKAGKISKIDLSHFFDREKFTESKQFGLNAPPHVVTGVDAVIHGHNPHENPIQNGNRFWIDTASFGPFTILESSEIIEMAKTHLHNQIIRQPSKKLNAWLP